MLIPVLLPRSPRLVTVLAGIVGVGAGYAALDVRWPDTRLRQICAMLDAPMLVTDQPLRLPRAWCPPDPSGPETPGGVPGSFAAAPPDAVCSVFFTSGSTGGPKGILATYRGLTDLLRPGAMPLRLGRSTVMSVAAPTPWDAFALELWGPLLNGGRCVLSHGEHLTPAEVREYVGARGLNTVWLTASLFNLFVEEDLGAFRGLTQVVTGGERLSPPHVREFLFAHPDIRLFNGYGPAENCIFSTMHAVTPEDCELPTGIPIGTPVGGTGVHIVDGGRFCGPGEVGEICLSGGRLSPGYLGDPDLTRRAFATLELGGAPIRGYRTGDLGWRDERGCFHFHGRLDRQVKVRGHRVEPAEIERHVAAHPAITQCVVLDVGDTSAELVACYRPCRPVCETELRDFLRDRLPRYLVPDRWLRLDRIPLLANGKIDGTAVRAWVSAAEHGRAPAHVTVDPLRAQLHALVRETTGLGALPDDRSLVEVGANSLQVLRLCIRVAHRFQVTVEPADVFARPTIARLAELIRDATVNRPQTDPVGGEAARRRTWPLTAMQSAILATEAADPTNQKAWLCALAWRISGTVDAGALRRAAHWVHRRHPALHARYEASAFPWAEIEPPTEPEFPVVSAADDEQARALLQRILDQPFDLSHGPAWRSALVKVVGGEAMFGVCVHHVAFDGWSEHVLARDLSTAYAAELDAPGAGRWVLDRLPWPAVEPADRARIEAQRRVLTGEITGAPPLVLPAPTNTAGTPARHLVRALDDGATRRCRGLARAHATTPFVVGLAGFAAAVHRLTGQTDFPVATPLAQRGPANQDAVACLLNLLCIRLRLPEPAGDPASLVGAARDGAGRALLTQDVPFADAVMLLRPHSDSGAPAVPNLFVLQQNVTPVLDLPGCRTRLSRSAPPHAAFDLHVELRLPDDAPGEVVVLSRTQSVARGFAESFLETFVEFLTQGRVAVGHD